MSLFRKVELIEEGMAKEKPLLKGEKMDLSKQDDHDESSEIRINENLIKIIENIVEKHLQRKTIKPKINVKLKIKKPSLKIISKPKKKFQNGGGIQWIYK